MREFLYGRNAARESLRARRRHIYQLIVAESARSTGIVAEIVRLAKRHQIPIRRLPRQELDKLARSHQGVLLEVGRYPTVEIKDILDRAAKLNEPPFVIVLDHIEDPHNLGAILRTIEIVGGHGVIIPKQRAAGISPTVVHVSAGAAEHILVAEVPNLVQGLKKLKQADIWIIGVENVSEALAYHEANLTGSVGLVIGGEGKGLRRLVKETCDFMVKLPMRGQVESLNASVATGLILYEVWRARGFR